MCTFLNSTITSQGKTFDRELVAASHRCPAIVQLTEGLKACFVHAQSVCIINKGLFIMVSPCPAGT